LISIVKIDEKSWSPYASTAKSFLESSEGKGFKKEKQNLSAQFFFCRPRKATVDAIIYALLTLDAGVKNLILCIMQNQNSKRVS
jgi:hypothetical protein